MKEKFIESEPSLRGMDKILTLLQPEVDEEGEVFEWKEVSKQVKPYGNMLEFTDNVREAVRAYTERKIPALKEAIPSISELDDDALLNALTNNWFEEIGEVEGQRREVLLTVAAHIVKRVESLAERKILSEGDEKELKKLGLNPSLRDLVVDLMKVSEKADAWFVRFLAYSRLSGKAPDSTKATSLYNPDDEKSHTMAEMFPHEAQFMAKGLATIAEKESDWRKQPGGEAFAKYLEALAQFFAATKISDAARLQKEVTRCYEEVLETDFPVNFTSIAGKSVEGYFKPPYLDPELRVAISVEETKTEEEEFKKARDLLAESLGEIDAQDSAGNVLKGEAKSFIVLGAFGSNLSFDTVAQEEPGYAMYLNHQIRAYDGDFRALLPIIKGGTEAFVGLSESERHDILGRLSRMTTMFHEFSHPVEQGDSKGAKRMGETPLTTVEEVKAEALWKALVPAMIEKGLWGTEEQWATAQLISSSLVLKEEDQGDYYFDAAAFNLNDLFKQGIVRFENGTIEITNMDAYFAAVKEQALEVISLYRDKEMTERKAKDWIKNRCTADKKLKQYIKFLKASKPEKE